MKTSCQGALRPTTDVVRRFERNVAGRDWIVGDIHGAYDQVLYAMQRAGFDPKVDRLFPVGDLTDRGPQSIRAKRFLEKPYVHSIAGNHCRALIEMYADGPPDPQMIEIMERVRPMGIDWWLKSDPETRDALVALMADLPIAIEIETERGLVGLVHADVPVGMDWSTFKQAVIAEAANPGQGKVTQTALWGRQRWTSADQRGVPGIDRLFVGHTPQFAGARRLGNVYGVDTGVIYGVLAEAEGDSDRRGHLTIMDACARSAAILTPEVVDLINVIDAEAAPGEPFGSYCRPS